MNDLSRRSLLKWAPVIGTALASPAGLFSEDKSNAEDVTPAEDLMREHGVLKRILLIYEEVEGRIAAKKDFAPRTVRASAEIIRTFIEQYHEKLEEDHLFPRFRKHHLLVELVDVLQQQHVAGRTVTERILNICRADVLKDDAKQTLAAALRQFVRMYAPHEAREDTVLFPALRKIISGHEYAALGEDFERKEHQLFGKEGFEGMVPRVEAIEKELGIYDLSQFTPR